MRRLGEPGRVQGRAEVWLRHPMGSPRAGEPCRSLQETLGVRDDEDDPAVWRALARVRALERERPRYQRYFSSLSDAQCWNCQVGTHHYSRCPRPLRVFCRRCGQDGRTTKDCPRCSYRK